MIVSTKTYPPWRDISLQWHQTSQIPLLRARPTESLALQQLQICVLTRGMMKLVVNSRACFLTITFCKEEHKYQFSRGTCWTQTLPEPPLVSCLVESTETVGKQATHAVLLHTVYTLLEMTSFAKVLSFCKKGLYLLNTPRKQKTHTV